LSFRFNVNVILKFCFHRFVLQVVRMMLLGDAGFSFTNRRLCRAINSVVRKLTLFKQTVVVV